MVGAPGQLKKSHPTHERTAKAYRPKFLLSYTFNVLWAVCPQSLIAIEDL